MYVTSTLRAVLIMWSGSISVPGLVSKRRIAGQTRDMKSRGEGAVRFRPDTHRGGGGGGGGGGGCCLAEEGEEPYMKWWGGGMGLQPHPPVSAHGVLYSPTIMYGTDL